jgi:hypothetical protein
MEIGEMVAVGFLQQQLDEECPFSDDTSGPSAEDSEDIADDDRDEVLSQQANDGGVLGKNLISASPGKAGTVGGPIEFKPPEYDEEPDDTKRPSGAAVMAFVPGADDIDDGTYPFLVAAHHLIPGEAALAPSELTSYMKKGSSITTVSGKTFTLKYHIGYNVNGSHNGVWLPGNYAIRASASPWQRTPMPGRSWSDLGQHRWCLHYVAAVSKVTGAQFHDAHEQYSDAALKLLNKIAKKLFMHQDVCEQCEKKDGGKIPPPYMIKERLYNLSAYFRRQTKANPQFWKRPWFASDRWRKQAFSGPRPSNEFLDAYERGRRIGNT